MNLRGRWALACALGLCLSSTALAQHGRGLVYEVTSISAKEMQIFPGGSEGLALDINNLGVMVGWGATATGVRHAFKRELLGATTDLGAAFPSLNSRALGINDHGEVVGARYQSTSDPFFMPFYWSPITGIRDLNRTDTAGASSQGGAASAINAQGMIAGCLSTGSVCRPAWWWHHSGVPASAPPPAGGGVDAPAGSWFEDVSDSGWFAGTKEEDSSAADRESAGFRYRLGNFDYLPDPSPLDRGSSAAVNEAGTIVGTTVYPGYGARAITYRASGSSLILGLPPDGVHSYGSDINENEFVVGYSDVKVLSTSEELRERAFLFHQEFGMIALPPPGGFRTPLLTDCRAYALNDRKENGLIQIAGYCTRYGTFQAVRWDVFVSEQVK